jgi:hypothetical protein
MESVAEGKVLPAGHKRTSLPSPMSMSIPNRRPPPSTTTARHNGPKRRIAGPRHLPVNECLVINNHHSMNDVARPRNDDDAACRRSPPDVLRRLKVTTHVVTVCIRFGCHVTTRHSLLDERQHASSFVIVYCQLSPSSFFFHNHPLSPLRQRHQQPPPRTIVT